MSVATRTLAEGLVFPEGPRWRGDRLWFSDMHDHRVKTLTQEGALETVIEVPGCPSGLGWTADGALLIVSMTDRRLLRWRGAGHALEEVADLHALAPFHCNDMVVDGTGRAYVGNFGFDLHAESPQLRTTVLIAVEPDGRAGVVAEELSFPNGTVITPDGRTLVVGESFAGRLTAFDIGADGRLSGRRVWAQLQGAVPDGICLDAESAIWVASPVSREVLRVCEGGEVTQRIPTEQMAIACMLGGVDRRTLFILTSETTHPDDCIAQRSARILTARVDVPGAGLP